MRGVKPRSSGLLMRLSPGRRGVVPLGCTPAHSPQGCRTGDGVGGWGQVWGREAYVWMTHVDMRRHMYRRRHTCGGSGHVSSHTHTPAGEVTLAYACGHGHTGTHVWAHTFPQMLLQLAQLPLGCKLVDGQGWGPKEAESSPVPSLLHYSLSKVAPLSPCHPATSLAPGTKGPLTVQGCWQGRDLIAPLPVGEGR